MIKIPILELNQIEWHDMPLSTINIDFSNSSVKLVIEKWNEQIEDYELNEVIFKETKNMVSDSLSLDSFGDESLESLEISKRKFESFFVTILINLGHGKSVWTLSFEAKESEISPSLKLRV